MNNNPFDDTIIDNAQKNLTTTISVQGIVNRLAEIEDELNSRGLDPLVKEKEELRKELKSFMLDTNTEMVYDETSEWEACITERSKDVWDIEKFEGFLTQSQLARYVKKMVDENAVKEGIKVGDLSRPTLERQGVVKKQPGTKALYVRKRKGE